MTAAASQGARFHAQLDWRLVVKGHLAEEGHVLGEIARSDGAALAGVHVAADSAAAAVQYRPLRWLPSCRWFHALTSS